MMSKYFAAIAIAVCLLGTAAASFAGPEDGRKGRGGHHMMMGEFGDPDRMLSHLSRRLDLDETQEQTIGNILMAAKPEGEALRERGMTLREDISSLDTADPDYDAKLQDLALQSGEVATSLVLLLGRVRSEISAELTDEQRQTMAEGRGHWRKRSGRRHDHSESNHESD